MKKLLLDILILRNNSGSEKKRNQPITCIPTTRILCRTFSTFLKPNNVCKNDMVVSFSITFYLSPPTMLSISSFDSVGALFSSIFLTTNLAADLAWISDSNALLSCITGILS